METMSLNSASRLAVRSPAGRSSAQLRLRSQDLFRGTHELIIEHQGQEYRLRLTRNDKLILNK